MAWLPRGREQHRQWGHCNIQRSNSSQRIGGVSQPLTNDVQRGIRNVLFDTANCGAYVFGSNLVDNSLEIIHLGNITVNPAVANPIAIQPRRPFSECRNSTNGRYDFTNNAASPNASIYINCLSNSTANTALWSCSSAVQTLEQIRFAHFDDANGGAVGSAGASSSTKSSGHMDSFRSNDLPQKNKRGKHCPRPSN